jgi:hypothetical protein
VKARTLGVTLAAAIAIASACATRVTDVEGPKRDKRSEIIALWTQIRDWRLQAKMELDPSPQTENSMRGMTVPQAKAVCPEGHQVPATCNDVCDLADAICDNAERICDIAAELGPDDKLGQEKCESAKASCREAKQRCCKCSEPAKATGT